VSTLILEISELFFVNLSHFWQVFRVDLTTDKGVVVVITQEYVVLELEFCLVVGTLAFGAAEFEDFTFVVVCAAGCDGFFEFLTRPVIFGPVGLDTSLHFAFASLRDG